MSLRNKIFRMTKVFWFFLTIGASPAFAQSNWEPCGGAGANLWSWAWAGATGEYTTTETGDFGKLIIRRLEDLSGNGNHYFNDWSRVYPNIQTQPGYQVGLTLSSHSWSTAYPPVALERYADTTQIYGQALFQATSIDAQDFYLAAAAANTRTGGNRFLWGTDTSNYVRLEQVDNYITIRINGGTETRLTANGSVPAGPVLVEIWRDAVGNIKVYINGVDETLGAPKNTDTFSMSGVGGPAKSASAWDDYAFEYIACDGLPSPARRDETREYMRSKWSLFGAIQATSRPKPPTNLTVE